MTIRFVDGMTRARQAEALAERVVEELQTAIDVRGRATLAVPGGTTPRAFLIALGRAELNWHKVAVTLTDERWLPAGHPRSNHGLLVETLLAGKPGAATFVPLYRDGVELIDAVAAIGAELEKVLLPLDICVLGMGTDGHTASLFPGADGLEAALDRHCPSPVLPIFAAGAGEPRITLTASVLLAARRIHLLIQGSEKRAVLAQSLAVADPLAAPVKAILEGANAATVWCAD